MGLTMTMPPLDPKRILSGEEVKAAFKEAMREWLDDKYRELGKWTARGFLAAVVTALGYMILVMNGWHKF